VTRRRALAALCGLALLTGCAGGIQGALGTATSAVGPGGTVSQIDALLPELILQKYQALHNLKVGMEAIDASPGPVTMTTPGPTIVPSPAPTATPMPSSPATVPPASGIPGTFPSSPSVSPFASIRRHAEREATKRLNMEQIAEQ
jgi:hypothetical protein